MNRLKKLWSLTAIFGMVIGMIPLSVFAETTEVTKVEITQAKITNAMDESITKENRLNQGEAVKIQLGWSLNKPALVEKGTSQIIELPNNLNYPDQSGQLADMGSFQLRGNQLRLTFNQNYKLSVDEKTPDFSSVKLYAGMLTLTATTIAQNLETEKVSFGKNISQTLYYNKQVDPAADPLVEKVTPQKRGIQKELNHNLKERGINLFNNMKITDLDGNEFSESNPAVKDANIKIHFDWSLDNSVDLQAGDFYEYQLPDYFSIHNSVNGDLKNDAGKTLGKFTLNQSGKLVVTFNEAGVNLSDREGTIDLQTELKLVTENEEVEIVTDIKDDDGEEINITIPVVKGDINKTGMINADNTVSWTIIVNEDRKELRNPIVTEHFPEGMKLLYHSYFVMNDAGVWEKSPDGFIQGWEVSEKRQYVYKLSKDIMNKPVKIVVNMKVTDKEKLEFLNKATITGDNFLENAAEASVSFNNKENYKMCTDYNVNTGIFNWEAKTTYSQDGGIFKDWMYQKYQDPSTANHYLLKDTIEVYDENNDLVTNWTYSEEPDDSKTKDDKIVHFTLKFADKGVYKIKYTTQSFVVPVPIQTEIYNTATIIDGDDSEDVTGGEKVAVDGTLGVDKGINTKDFANHTFDWQVRVNKNRILMKDAVIADKFTSLNGTNVSAMQLIEDSLEITAENGTTKKLVKGTDYTLEKLAGDPDYKTGFTVKLINNYAATTDLIIMKYKTKYSIDEQNSETNGPARIKFDNSVLVTYTGEDGRPHTDGDECAVWLHKDLSYNGLKFGKYVPKGGEVASAYTHENPFSETIAEKDSVYWTALFNTWKRELPKDTTIEEALGEGQTARDIVIYDVNINPSAVIVASLGTKWVEDTDYKIEEKDGKSVITLLKEKNNPFAIFVAADAAEEVYKYKNVATMTIPGMKDPLKVEGMAEKSDKDAWIDKSGVQGTGDDYRKINWSVVLNKDAHKIVEPYIQDTISVNDQSFIYDDDKNVVVKVYKAKSDGKNGFVKDGDALIFAEDDKPYVSVDAVNGTQTLTIDLGESISSPYIVEYQTLLDPGIKNNEKISNSATLFGKDISIQNTSKEVVIKSTDGEGTSSGKNGSLTIEKLDKDNNLITSDSAFFDLYRKDNDGNLALLFSDIEVKGDKIIEDGIEVNQISNLRYGTYVIVENTAPNGYVKNDQKSEFVISKDQVHYTFSLVNQRQILPGSVQLEAKKELSGRPLKAEEFSFTLKGDGNVNETKKNDEDGKILFDEIKYAKAGTYEYTITEATPSTPELGITYDSTQYKVTVTVTEKAGKLEADVVYENVKSEEVPVFKNTYKAIPGSVQLEAKKELSGRPLKAEEFSFTLKGDGNVNETKKNDEDGKILFDEIKYDKAGTYEYTITEAIPSTPELGITYDSTQYKVTVTVTEKAGKLEADVVYENVKAEEIPVFKNTYKAIPGSVQLEAKKEFSGRPLKAEEFSFTLKGDGNVNETKKNDEDGKILFDEIKYDKAGTYEYTITEETPSTPELGITYDSTQYKVTVTVTEKAGKLEADVVYENVKAEEVPVFKNTYKAIPGSVQLEAKKELSGRPLKAEEFSFTLKGDGNVNETKKNDEDGKILFDKIKYDKAGTYEYTITEATPSTPELGVTYDSTQYKVTVTVTEKAGKLEADVVYENVKEEEIPVFKNTYKAIPGSVQLEAKKELSGRPLKAEEFSFTLKGDGNVNETKKNDEDGKILFDEIKYDKAGTYEYTITEATPSTPELGVTYDSTQYKVTVTVTEKAGKLEADVVYENVKAEEVPVFKNTYKAIPGSVQLEAKKELSGRPLKAEEFSFTLKGDGNVNETKKNDEDGKILFDEIKYDKAGTYEYTITEATPSTPELGVTYDSTQYKVTVTVTEKAGKLEADVVYENVKEEEIPVFKNTYKAIPGSVQLEAKKELSGRPLKAEEFSFTLKGDGNVNETKKNDEDGKILFDEIKYDKAGTYEYTITEATPSTPELGVTYDSTQYKVTVTVTEKAGKLEADVVYENVKEEEIPVFKNTYKAIPGSVQLEAKKELSGRPLKAEEFSFTLKGDGNVNETKKNDEDGKILFDEIKYDKAGTYEYTITEAIPEVKDPNITYDDTEFKVTVNVEEKAGKLVVNANYSVNGQSVDNLSFKNSYTPPKTVNKGEILLKKVDSKTGKTLANAEFKLLTVDDNPVVGYEKIVTREDGTIFIKGLGDGSYKLIETKAPAGYQIDETPIRFSVKNSQPSQKEISKENTRIPLSKTHGTNENNEISTNLNTTRKTTTTKRMPATGSTSSWSLILIGIFFLVSFGCVLLGKLRKHS